MGVSCSTLSSGHGTRGNCQCCSDRARNGDGCEEANTDEPGNDLSDMLALNAVEPFDRGTSLAAKAGEKANKVWRAMSTVWERQISSAQRNEEDEEETAPDESSQAKLEDIETGSSNGRTTDQESFDGNRIPDSVLSETTSNCTAVSQTDSVTRRSAILVNGALKGFAKQNPDDIKNVYRFDKGVLASGSFGTVRRGTVKATGAQRAINFVPKTKTAEEIADVRARVEVTSKFDHPNIVSLHEVFEDQEFVYLVMDSCPGGTLELRLKQGVLSEVKAVFLMQQVLHAVYYLHKNDVSHRDLQTQKILFISSAKDINSTSAIKVSGFATSCQMRRRQKLSDIVGRAGYMAPEMAAGNYGQECDVWSCGVVLFEMLSGRLPFPPGDVFEVPGSPSKKDEKLTLFTAQDANISRAARDIVGLLLVVDPRARYTVKQALNHAWLRRGARKLTTLPFDASPLAQLKVFRRYSAFQQAGFRIIAGHLNDAEAANSRKLFLFLNKDGDGKIMPSELEKIIGSDTQILAAYPEISEMFRSTDHTDPCRKLPYTYTEFVAATFNRKQCLTEEAVRVAFRCLDKNGNGSISMSEFAACLAGENKALADCHQGINDGAAKNADHCVDFEEFLLLMRGAEE